MSDARSPHAPAGNQLTGLSSAYLRQHAQQPVHWLPWTEKTLIRAHNEQRPIFLSIGYSACHWCHVMARESFSDVASASFLNEHFLCIKVDREEHPAVDDYYQRAAQLMGQGGGWPLNAFLGPDLNPFFIGTYFPKDPAPVAPGEKRQATFQELMQELARVWREEREKAQETAQQVGEALRRDITPEPKEPLPQHFPHPMNVMKAVDPYLDKEWGGMGKAPKFPLFPFWEFCLEQMMEGLIEKDPGLVVLKTLEHQLLGGIFDQARGGIHRYATDRQWRLPHFEKMLFDQAGLLSLLARASMIFPVPAVFDGIAQTLDYLQKEMLSDEGYFFSAQDAESEGVEGLYFTFKEEELKALWKEHFSSAEAQQLRSWMELSAEGALPGGLHTIHFLVDRKKELYEHWPLVQKFKRLLQQERAQRIPPQTDPKGVASWNFMLVAALVDVIQYATIPALRAQAQQLLAPLEKLMKTFVREERGKAQLIHSTSSPEGGPYLEDYAFFTHMNVRLFELSGNESFLANALQAREFIWEHFWQQEKLWLQPPAATRLPLQAPWADQGHASAAATFLLTARRLEVIRPSPTRAQALEQLRVAAFKGAMTNPVGGAQAMRAVIVPQEVMRALQVPRSWLSNPSFSELRGKLPYRFILHYHDQEEGWNIQHQQGVEHQGEGLASLQNLMQQGGEKT